jgi:hypothetical protein
MPYRIAAPQPVKVLKQVVDDSVFIKTGPCPLYAVSK